MKNPLNYVVLTTMVLVGLLAFDAVKRWVDGNKTAMAATSTTD